MGANQSHPPSSSHSNSHPTYRPYRPNSPHSIISTGSAHSAPAAPSLTRCHAVRHRTNPSPSSGSYREHLIANGQIQTIIPSHYTEPAYADFDIFGNGSNSGNDNISGHDRGNGNGPYHPPFLTGPDPFTIQRRRAIRTQTPPSAAPGSRREAMLRSQVPPAPPSSSHSPDSFTSRMVSFRDMGCPPPLFTTLPTHNDSSYSAPAPQYLVKPRPKNAGPRKSRFREEL